MLTGPRRPRDSNPCLGIRESLRNQVARFFDTDELERLGRALDGRQARWPEGVAAIRLLALTGCRRGEVLTLRWRDIGPDAIHLADGKTGPRAVPLSTPARAGIDALPSNRNTDEFHFPYDARNRVHQGRLRERWLAVCADAGIGRAPVHDLRHATTAGYAHLADDHLVLAAERVGSVIAERWPSDAPHPTADGASAGVDIVPFKQGACIRISHPHPCGQHCNGRCACSHKRAVQDRLRFRRAHCRRTADAVYGDPTQRYLHHKGMDKAAQSTRRSLGGNGRGYQQPWRNLTGSIHIRMACAS